MDTENIKDSDLVIHPVSDARLHHVLPSNSDGAYGIPGRAVTMLNDISVMPNIMTMVHIILDILLGNANACVQRNHRNVIVVVSNKLGIDNIIDGICKELARINNDDYSSIRIDGAAGYIDAWLSKLDYNAGIVYVNTDAYDSENNYISDILHYQLHNDSNILGIVTDNMCLSSDRGADRTMNLIHDAYTDLINSTDTKAFMLIYRSRGNVPSHIVNTAVRSDELLMLYTHDATPYTNINMDGMCGLELYTRKAHVDDRWYMYVMRGIDINNLMRNDEIVMLPVTSNLSIERADSA